MPETAPDDAMRGQALVVWRPLPAPVVPVTPVTVLSTAAQATPDPPPCPAPDALLARVRKSYLTVQWAGPDDRRPPAGGIRREVL